MGWNRQETDAYLGLKPQESYQGKCLNERKEGRAGKLREPRNHEPILSWVKERGRKHPRALWSQRKVPWGLQDDQPGSSMSQGHQGVPFSWGCVHLVMAFRCCDLVLVILPKVGGLQDSFSWLPKSSVSLIHSRSHS